MIVTSDTREHIGSTEATLQIDGRYGYGEITDGCALTIASWYQSPSGFGTTFAELSTTGKVDHMDLLDAIRYERKNANYHGNKALDMLCTWALSKRRELGGWILSKSTQQRGAPTILGTIWVCVDCMLVHANGECGPDPDREPLNLIPGGQTVTMGILLEEHQESCTEADREEGCDCDRIEFSWASCEGCGSTLGGDRYGMTLWQD